MADPRGHVPRRDESILRDRLASDRTMLANERTFLAYVRTALTLFVAGVSMLHFFESIWIWAAGWAFIPLGFLTFAIGAVRFRTIRRLVRKRVGAETEAEESSSGESED
jgi:putative membrane protein